MPELKEVFAVNYQLAKSVVNPLEMRSNKKSYVSARSCNGRLYCLGKGAVFLAAFVIAPIAGPIFGLYTFTDQPQLWNYNFCCCLLDSTLLVATSPFLFLALSIKYIAAAIINPKICLKNKMYL